MSAEEELVQQAPSLAERQLDLTDNQIQFAESLGINDAESLEEVVQLIERALGQRNIRELTRWFLMSVYRHCLRSKWEDLADCGISESTQQELVDQLVASDEFKQSILTVLKDVRCRYTLLTFSKTRNPAKRSLANSTKAFKQARQLLRDLELVKTPGRKTTTNSGRTVSGEEAGSHSGMAVSRRAARRGYSVDTPQEEPIWEKPPEAKAAQEDPLTDEEFRELDEALEGSGEDSGQRFTYNTNEERLSLLLGVLAGFAACVLLLWVIY